ARQCQITLEPTAVILRDGDPGVVLQAVIRHRPPDRPPQMLLRQQPGRAPELLAALQQLMDTAFRGPLPGPVPGTEQWEVDLALSLAPTLMPGASDDLTGLAAYDPPSPARQVVVPLSADAQPAGRPTAATAAQADFLLRVSPRQTEYPGLLAIDLGTSSSTVTLYDPSVVPDNRRVPPEQERRLRDLLLETLVDEEGRGRLPGVVAEHWTALVGALDLPGEGPAPQRLRAALQRGGPDFLEALRQIEVHV